MPLTQEQKDKVFQYLEGTCNSLHGAIEIYELDCDDAELEDAMLDFNIELCPTCGWWCECHDRIPDDEYPGTDGMTPDIYCDNCRPNKENYVFQTQS